MSEHYAWYYLTVKSGERIALEDIVIKDKSFPNMTEFNKWIVDASKIYKHELHHFLSEPEAENHLREYKKQLSKIELNRCQDKIDVNKWGLQKTVPELLKEPVIDNPPPADSRPDNLYSDNNNWGGARDGSGVKKGYQQLKEHIDKRIAKLKETAQRKRELRNETKDK